MLHARPYKAIPGLSGVCCERFLQSWLLCLGSCVYFVKSGSVNTNAFSWIAMLAFYQRKQLMASREKAWIVINVWTNTPSPVSGDVQMTQNTTPLNSPGTSQVLHGTNHTCTREVRCSVTTRHTGEDTARLLVNVSISVQTGEQRKLCSSSQTSGVQGERSKCLTGLFQRLWISSEQGVN